MYVGILYIYTQCYYSIILALLLFINSYCLVQMHTKHSYIISLNKFISVPKIKFQLYTYNYRLIYILYNIVVTNYYSNYTESLLSFFFEASQWQKLHY